MQLSASTVPKSPEELRLQDVALKLRHLMTTQEWDSYGRELDDLERRLIERLISTPQEHEFIRGQIDAIRQARTLPERLVAKYLAR